MRSAVLVPSSVRLSAAANIPTGVLTILPMSIGEPTGSPIGFVDPASPSARDFVFVSSGIYLVSALVAGAYGTGGFGNPTNVAGKLNLRSSTILELRDKASGSVGDPTFAGAGSWVGRINAGDRIYADAIQSDGTTRRMEVAAVVVKIG